MTGLWIALGIFAFFFLIFIIPIHVMVGLTDNVSVMVRVLFLKIPILPKEKKKKSKDKDKKKKPKEKKKKKKEKPDKKEKKKKKDKKNKNKKNISDIVGLVQVLLDTVVALFKRLGRNFKIRVHAYEICVASEEAAKTAVMYGAVKTLSETIFLRLEDSINFKIVKGAPMGVYADFLEEKFKANVKIDFSISIAGVFGVLFAAIFKFIGSFIKMLLNKKLNKNG
jgi:hypothetical protein